MVFPIWVVLNKPYYIAIEQKVNLYGTRNRGVGNFYHLALNFGVNL